MQDSFDVTTIIFLALAVFVIWRLRSVLGQKTGAERSPFKPVDRSRTEPQARSDGDNVVRLPVPTGSRPRRARRRAAGLAGHRRAGIRGRRGLEACIQAEPASIPAPSSRARNPPTKPS